MSNELQSRRRALKCLAYGGAGTLFALSGGVLMPIDLAAAAVDPARAKRLGRPLFVQISDTHIGFNKEANPDVNGTLARAVDLVNAMPEQPRLILHTGDITHLSRPAEFDLAREMLSRLRVAEMHTVPGEHDTSDPGVTEYFSRFGAASNNKGYYSFDHAGVHFVGLVNVLEFKAGGLGTLGGEQLAWAKADLRARSSSTPIVVFAHMPLWTIYEPWGWGTGDAGELFDELRRFGSVTVLNGHIHQIVRKVEGAITFHTARSTAYPQPAAGQGAGPGPLTVAADELPRMLGLSSVAVAEHPRSLVLSDYTLAGGAEAADDSGASSPPAGAGSAVVPGSAAGAAASGSRATGTAGTDTALAAVPAAAIGISMRGFMFAPPSLAVKSGAMVTWTNLDQEPHTVVSDSGLFRSGALDTHESFSHRFAARGTYRYFCTIHPRMTGTIVVE
jgi:plastocyanin